MSTFSAQEAFNAAKEFYNRGKELVNSLSSKARQISPSFSYDIALREYDMILQGILLNVAMADGFFVSNEKLFIKELTDYSDILYRLNSEMRKTKSDWIDVTWDNLASCDDKTRKLIAATALVFLNEFVDDFIEPFAIIDAKTSRNYLDELKENISYIIGCLAVVDGDDTDSYDVHKEIETGINAFNTFVEQKWKDIKYK